jgi:hypothetical protein
MVSAEGSFEPGAHAGARTSVTSTGDDGGGAVEPVDCPTAGGPEDSADVKGGVSREVAARSLQASPMQLTNTNRADVIVPTGAASHAAAGSRVCEDHDYAMEPPCS